LTEVEQFGGERLVNAIRRWAPLVVLSEFLPAAASNVGRASVEMSLDMRFSHHGEAVPQITAPPVTR